MVRHPPWAPLVWIAAYVVVAVSPCAHPAGDSAHAPIGDAHRIAEVHAHPGIHASHPAAELAPERAEHAGCAEEAVGLALSAPCPCGCDDAVAAPGTAGGIGLALTSVPPVWVVPVAHLPIPSPPRGSAPAPVRPIEHVPLPV